MPAKTETTDPAEDLDGVIEGTVFTERQVVLLKRVVIGLGLLIILGFALMISIVVYRATQMSEDNTGGQAVISQSVSQANAKLAAIAIAQGSKVISTSVDGSRVAITVQNKSGYSILVIDARSGKLLSRTELTPPQ